MIANSSPTAQNRENPWISLLINIILPALILMKLSSDEYLGAVYGLLFALSFPLIYGILEIWRRRQFSLMSILGIISVLLTGGIGILKLDPSWIAVKEAAIPLIIGLGVLVTANTRYCVLRLMFYNDTLINLDKVDAALEKYGTQLAFEQRMKQATYLLSTSFFLSSFLNYALAKWIVVSPAGTTAFNEELGQMNLLSYPVIVLPSMLVLFAALWFFLSGVKQFTQLSWEEIIKSQ